MCQEQSQCVLGEQSQRQWKPVSHRKADHREVTVLPCGSMDERDKELPPSSGWRELRLQASGVKQQSLRR